jgi:hypothetical protein
MGQAFLPFTFYLAVAQVCHRGEQCVCPMKVLPTAHSKSRAGHHDLLILFLTEYGERRSNLCEMVRCEYYIVWRDSLLSEPPALAGGPLSAPALAGRKRATAEMGISRR